LSTGSAYAGNEILETTGLSLAVGTILGASTLPFYSEPGEHTSNLWIGAALGTVAGLGTGVYRSLSSPSRKDRLFSDREYRLASNRMPQQSSQTPYSTRSNRLSVPLVSLTW